DQEVLSLGGAHFVVVELVLVGQGRELTTLGLVITGVEETFVALPGNAAEFDVHQGVLDNFPGDRVDHDALSPIAAPLGNEIGSPGTVLGKTQAHQGGGAVLGEGVGIQKHLFRAMVPRPVDHVLVLQPIVLGIVGIVSLLVGGAHLFVVPKCFQSIFQLLPKGNLVQIPKGGGILLFYPGLGLGAAVIFEPSVGVLDLDTEVGVHDIPFLGSGIVHHDRISFCGFLAGRKKNDQGQKAYILHFLGLYPIKIT